MIRFRVSISVFVILMLASAMYGQGRPSLNNTRNAEMLRFGQVTQDVTGAKKNSDGTIVMPIVPIKVQVKITKADDVYVGQFKIPPGAPPTGEWKIVAQNVIVEAFNILDMPATAANMAARKVLEQSIVDLNAGLIKAKKAHTDGPYKGTYRVGVVANVNDTTTQPDTVYQDRIDAIRDATAKVKQASR